MKNIYILIILCFSFCKDSISQIFKADDGTTVEVFRVDDNPDNGRNASIYAGVWSPDGIRMLGFNYLKPKKFYVNADVFPGASGSISFFVKNWKKEKSITQSIKATTQPPKPTIDPPKIPLGLPKREKNVHVKYTAKVPIQKRKSLGITLGGGYAPVYITGEGLKSSNISLGASLLTSFHANWKIRDKYFSRQGTVIRRLNADVVFYLNPQFDDYSTIDPDAVLEDISKKIGMRIYWDGKATIWSKKGRISLHYTAGIGTNVHKKPAIYPIAGVGIGYNFL